MTSLVSGDRIDKSDLLLESYGTVDELNSFIGLLMSAQSIEEYCLPELEHVQNCLFNIGSILAKGDFKAEEYPSIDESHISFLEERMDDMNSKLQPLRAFVLPSGSESVSRAHVCRTVCRRAERRVASILDENDDFGVILKYLNRLSDYFFVLSRFLCDKEGVAEKEWNKNI